MQFKEYQALVEKYIAHDCREVNFQNRVILIFLESLLKDKKSIEIVDVSTQYKNRETKLHTRKEYAGQSTPDLLIAENWDYNNKNNSNINYLAVVEIKIPKVSEMTNVHTKSEIECYMNLGRKVILTNCYQWDFYIPQQSNSVKTVSLYHENKWNDIQQWNVLCDYIKKFI
ncbi:MAG: hypothetical protein IJ644_07845 [Oscillospiraceae bacterium]|nr:hypothetical protein [Oscillospiraceae bacterium]